MKNLPAFYKPKAKGVIKVIRVYIYKITIERENLIKALKRLKFGKNNGIDEYTKTKFKKTLDNAIDKLAKELKKQKYKPGPIRIIYVTKPGGGKRALGISSVRDKIVQSAFHNEIQKIYEPIFRNSSFGFRPKKNSHSALKIIRQNWQPIKWIIKLDLKKKFNRIQHDILISLLQKKLNDQETVDLIKKFLKVGYIDIYNLANRERYKEEGIPQGTIISPLLANVYLHELDEFVKDTLFKEYTIEKKKPLNKKAQYYLNSTFKKTNSIIQEFPELEKIIPKIKIIDNCKNFYKKLYYVRYVDHLLLGSLMSKEDCKKIIFKINNFLKKKMCLELNLDKCEINLVQKTTTNFLGFCIGQYKNKIKSNVETIEGISITKLNMVTTNLLTFLIPIKDLLHILAKKGFLRRLEKSDCYKGTGLSKLIPISDRKIVDYYSSIIRGYTNYYSCANHRSSLWSVIHGIKESCYQTLAWKFKSKNKKKIIEKYGPKLRIHENGKLITELFYPESLKTEMKYFDKSIAGDIMSISINFGIIHSKNVVSKRYRSSNCLLCNSTEKLELHKITFPNIEKKIINHNRKSITLCIICHKSSYCINK